MQSLSFLLSPDPRRSPKKFPSARHATFGELGRIPSSAAFCKGSRRARAGRWDEWMKPPLASYGLIFPLQSCAAPTTQSKPALRVPAIKKTTSRAQLRQAHSGGIEQPMCVRFHNRALSARHSPLAGGVRSFARWVMGRGGHIVLRNANQAGQQRQSGMTVVKVGTKRTGQGTCTLS